LKEEKANGQIVFVFTWEGFPLE